MIVRAKSADCQRPRAQRRTVPPCSPVGRCFETGPGLGPMSLPDGNSSATSDSQAGRQLPPSAAVSAITARLEPYELKRGKAQNDHVPNSASYQRLCPDHPDRSPVHDIITRALACAYSGWAGGLLLFVGQAWYHTSGALTGIIPRIDQIFPRQLESDFFLRVRA